MPFKFDFYKQGLLLITVYSILIRSTFSYFKTIRLLSDVRNIHNMISRHCGQLERLVKRKYIIVIIILIQTVTSSIKSSVSLYFLFLEKKTCSQ